jgi:hypothetical protein
MQNWEYHVVVRMVQNREWKWADPAEKRNGPEVLSDLGKQGWELVTVVPILDALDQPSALYRASSNFNGTATTVLHYIFKRPA